MPLLFVLLALYTLYPVQASAWTGTVLRVHDGDTVSLALNGVAAARITVRLYGIDAPEKDQPHGREATAALAGLAPVGSSVSVADFGPDRYGRLTGVVVAGGRCLNTAMLERGHAWLYTRYCRAPVCREWQRAASRAEQQGLGLWSDETRIPPWKWRAETR